MRKVHFAGNDFSLSRLFRGRADPKNALPGTGKPKTIKRLSPISVRLSLEEKERLLQDAGNMSVNAYVKSRLFGTDPPKRRRATSSVKDKQALARVLAALGQSGLAHDLNDLEWSVEAESVKLSPASEKKLRAACAAIIAMREDLARALGHRER
ncbi:MAG: hypothetical protein AAGI03_17720 [Pseudomonadota bacterium]